jgi:hypothetical protein
VGKGYLYREVLDHVIILNERHLWRVLQSYLRYYSPSPTGRGQGEGPIKLETALAGPMSPYTAVKTAISPVANAFFSDDRLPPRSPHPAAGGGEGHCRGLLGQSHTHAIIAYHPAGELGEWLSARSTNKNNTNRMTANEGLARRRSITRLYRCAGRRSRTDRGRSSS